MTRITARGFIPFSFSLLLYAQEGFCALLTKNRTDFNQPVSSPAQELACHFQMDAFSATRVQKWYSLLRDDASLLLYCPLSGERKGTDSVYANDRPVDVPSQILEEAKCMSALGTGITGGEPLLCLDAVTGYCHLLKNHFGQDHQHPSLHSKKPPAMLNFHR